MAQQTVANMRGFAQELVLDTSATNPGISTAIWLDLLNDAMFAYAENFADVTPLMGLLASSANFVSTATSTTVTFSGLTVAPRNITNAFLRKTGGTVLVNEMERVNFTDLLRELVNVASLSPAPPTRYAIVSSAPGVAATALVYTVRLWPISDNNYNIDFYGTVQPAALTGDSDTTVFQDVETRTITRMAAVEAARMLGRPGDFIGALAAPLSDRIKAHMGVMARDVRPAPAGSAGV
jgi:hypothetical protein